MKITIILLLLVTTRADNIDDIKQQNNEQRIDQQADNSDKRDLLEGNAGLLNLNGPQGGIEYANSKESSNNKPAQQAYEAPSPELKKISDLLTVQGFNFHDAISNQLFSPLSIYQQRLDPPQFEVSAPVPAQLAYSEHQMYQVPQNLLINPQNQKKEQKQLKAYQPQSILLGQRHVKRPQSIISPAEKAAQIFQQYSPLFSKQDHNAASDYQYQEEQPTQQQLTSYTPQSLPTTFSQAQPVTSVPPRTTALPDSYIYVRGTQLFPLKFNHHHFHFPNIQSVRKLSQQNYLFVKKPYSSEYLQPVQPDRPVDQAARNAHQQYQVTNSAFPYPVSINFVKAEDSNKYTNVRSQNTAPTTPVALPPHYIAHPQGGLSYSSVNLEASSALFSPHPDMPNIKHLQYKLANEENPARHPLSAAKVNPNILISKNVHPNLSKPIYIHQSLTYPKKQLNPTPECSNSHVQDFVSQAPLAPKYKPYQYFRKYADSIFGNYDLAD